MFLHKFSDRVHIVAPYRIRHLASQHQPRPTWDAVAPRKRELRIGQLGFPRLNLLRCEFLKFTARGCIAFANLGEQVFRLMS
jgi:hypothetical protein